MEGEGSDALRFGYCTGDDEEELRKRDLGVLDSSIEAARIALTFGSLASDMPETEMTSSDVVVSHTYTQ